MLEKPDIADAAIIDCLHDDYEVIVSRLEFLPLGADRYTAVYRAESADRVFFVKLRSGDFDKTAVLVPWHLHDHVIAPIANRHGLLWTRLHTFHVIVSPFVRGENGFDRELSAQNWIDFGHALRTLHSAPLPPVVIESIPREQFSDEWRAKVRDFQAQAESHTFADPAAHAFAAFLRAKKPQLDALIAHAERLAAVMRSKNVRLSVCHADIHVGNLLITPDDRLYLVDWDTLIRAPKERDLMFIGIGFGCKAFSVDEQAELVYRGYGQVEIDAEAIAYYRCERILQDAAAYAEQILLTSGDSADRLEGLRQFQSQFEPGAVVDRAFDSVARIEAG